MRDYSKLDILIMFNNCRVMDEILQLCETLKWLMALEENISYHYVREVAAKRTREII